MLHKRDKLMKRKAIKGTLVRKQDVFILHSKRIRLDMTNEAGYTRNLPFKVTFQVFRNIRPNFWTNINTNTKCWDEY